MTAWFVGLSEFVDPGTVRETDIDGAEVAGVAGFLCGIETIVGRFTR